MTYSKNLKLAAAAGVFASAILTAGSAMAIPTIVIDGIAIPSGITPGGNTIAGQLDQEQLILAPGQSFAGIGKVTDIADANSNFTYFYGQGGRYLTDVFSGFVVDTIVAPTATSAGTITFYGGNLSYYVHNSNPNTTTGNQATDFAHAAAGTLFLNLVPDAIDALGHTLIITIPQGGNSLTQFAGASAQALLDVSTSNPGEAGNFFATCAFANSFGSGGCSDINFIGAANSGASGDFPVSGHDTVKANAVPEPASLAMFGSALLGFGWVRRQRSKA